jgi:probable rRNA maturation factor
LDPSSQNFIELETTDSTSRTIYRIDLEKIESLTKHICAGLGVSDFELSWDFTSDEQMRALNHQYRDKDRTTDVLSFPQQEWQEPLSFDTPKEEDFHVAGEGPPDMLGDVVISPSVALQNAKSIGHGLDREVAFLLVHGILHLCGHDHLDPDEEERMTKEQQIIMKYLESHPKGPLWIDCVSMAEV